MEMSLKTSWVFVLFLNFHFKQFLFLWNVKSITLANWSTICYSDTVLLCTVSMFSFSFVPFFILRWSLWLFFLIRWTVRIWVSCSITTTVVNSAHAGNTVLLQIWPKAPSTRPTPPTPPIPPAWYGKTHIPTRDRGFFCFCTLWTKFCEILKFGNNLKLEIIDYIFRKIILLKWSQHFRKP